MPNPSIPSPVEGAGGATMLAAVLRDVGRIEVGAVPRPRPLPHEVLVRVQAVGLCGTDLHIFAGHANYNTDARGRRIPLTDQPQVLGHEITGVVEEVGAEVADLRPGERVVLDQGRTCVGERRAERCEYCQSGDSHQCEQYREHGITGPQGGLAQFIAVPAANAVRIDAGLPPEHAVLTEPLGCIVHSVDVLLRTPSRYRIRPGPGERPVTTALVCGAGPAGLLFTQYLRRGVGYEGRLLVMEPNPAKRALAERFGAETIDPSAEDPVDAVARRTGGRRVELLIEATGSGPLFAQIPGLIRKQATVVLYGHGHAGVELSALNSVQFIEPTLVSPTGASGGFEADGRPTTYLRALRLIESGTIEVAPLVTHRYHSLDAVPDAFAGDHGRPDYVKGVVVLD